MSCDLTQGYNFAGCKGGASGVSRILIMEYNYLVSTAQTANVITTITRASGEVFRAYVLDEEMADHNDALAFSKENGTNIYNHTVNFTIKGLTNALKAEIKLLSRNKLVMIVEGRDGVYWMYGVEKGLDLMTADAASGRLLEDFNGFTLSFMGKSTDYAHTVDPSIIAALLTP